MKVQFALLPLPVLSINDYFNSNDLELDEIILKDMIYPGSPKCRISNDVNNKNFTTNYTFQYDDSDSHGKWSEVNAPKEKYNFLAQMHHEDFLNPNRTWTIRFGKGGTIYSLAGAYGEAIPPQTRGDSPWIDEVIQGVGVDLTRNRPQDGTEYFIHQAGVYSKDPPYITEETEPFYSPIIGKHCHDNTCIFLSWGQQAHVPTVFKSDLLYLYQYSDCGNGVIEFSQMFINVADKYGNSINYLNIPWGGVRRSTFREVLLSDTNGNMLPRDDPLQRFGDEGGRMPPLHQTGGFTTFAQKLINSNAPIQLPCGIPDGRGGGSKIKGTCTHHDIESGGFVRLKLVVQRNNACTDAVKMSKKYRDNIVACRTHNIPRFPKIRNCSTCGSEINIIVQQRNATAVLSNGIVLLSWQGRLTYFRSSKKSEELNKIWRKGDNLQIYAVDNGIPYEENLALCYVHGTDDEYYDTDNNWYTAPTRMRYGQAGRDFNVFTINGRLSVRPGQAYVSRQFLINGPLPQIEGDVTQWVGETVNDLLETEDFFGRSLVIYSSIDNYTYGVAAAAMGAGETTTCLKGVRRCVGSSVPKEGMVAFFSITCGNMTYLGPDRYNFGLPQNVTDSSAAVDPIRSYVCDDLGHNVRPVWKLMGYFSAQGGCEFLRNASYDKRFCLTSPSPLPRSKVQTRMNAFARMSLWNLSNLINSSLSMFLDYYKIMDQYDHWVGEIIHGM